MISLLFRVSNYTRVQVYQITITIEVGEGGGGYVETQETRAGLSDLAPKEVRLDPKRAKSVTFSDFAEPKCHEVWSKKSRRVPI